MNGCIQEFMDDGKGRDAGLGRFLGVSISDSRHCCNQSRWERCKRLQMRRQWFGQCGLDVMVKAGEYGCGNIEMNWKTTQDWTIDWINSAQCMVNEVRCKIVDVEAESPAISRASRVGSSRCSI